MKANRNFGEAQPVPAAQDGDIIASIVLTVSREEVVPVYAGGTDFKTLGQLLDEHMVQMVKNDPSSLVTDVAVNLSMNHSRAIRDAVMGGGYTG